MKTHVSAFFLYALLLGSSLLPAQTLEWAKALHGTNGSAATTVTSVACDSEGNIFITGWFSGAVDFDPGAGVQSLSSAGSNDIFIGKYSAEGNLIWVHRLGGSNSNDGGLAIAVDPLGNPIVTGQFARTVDFDPGPASATLNSGGGNSNIFVLKLDQGGNYIWVRGFGGIFDDLGRAVDTDAQGNVYVTGVFRNTMNVAGTTLTSMGGNDVFLIKIDPAGAILWQTSFGDNNDDAGLGLAVHGSIIYLTGRFEKQPLVSPGIQLQSSGGADAFILKATATGQVLWAKSLGGGGMDEGFGLATAPSGEVLLSGWFSGIADMNPDPVLTDTITASGGNDAFLVRLDENGNYQWARGFGGSNSDIGYDVVASSSGRTYLSGWFVGNDANFGTTTSPLLLSSNGQMDAFCAAFDSLGNTLWAHNLGGNGMDRSLSLVMQDFDRVVLAGDFQSTADFNLGTGTTTLTSTGNYDSFVLKLSDSLSLQTLTGTTTDAKFEGQSQTLTYPPLANVLVKLLDDQGLLLDSAFSDLGGAFSFDSISSEADHVIAMYVSPAGDTFEVAHALAGSNGQMDFVIPASIASSVATLMPGLEYLQLHISTLNETSTINGYDLQILEAMLSDVQRIEGNDVAVAQTLGRMLILQIALERYYNNANPLLEERQLTIRDFTLFCASLVNLYQALSDLPTLSSHQKEVLKHVSGLLGKSIRKLSQLTLSVLPGEEGQETRANIQEAIDYITKILVEGDLAKAVIEAASEEYILRQPMRRKIESKYLDVTQEALDVALLQGLSFPVEDGFEGSYQQMETRTTAALNRMVNGVQVSTFTRGIGNLDDTGYELLEFAEDFSAVADWRSISSLFSKTSKVLKVTQAVSLLSALAATDAYFKINRNDALREIDRIMLRQGSRYRGGTSTRDSDPGNLDSCMTVYVGLLRQVESHIQSGQYTQADSVVVELLSVDSCVSAILDQKLASIMATNEVLADSITGYPDLFSSDMSMPIMEADFSRVKALTTCLAFSLDSTKSVYADSIRLVTDTLETLWSLAIPKIDSAYIVTSQFASPAYVLSLAENFPDSLDPGARALIKVVFYNAGNTSAEQVNATVLSQGGLITPPQSIPIGSLPPGAKDSIFFEITAPMTDTLVGYRVLFSAENTSAGGIGGAIKVGNPNLLSIMEDGVVSSPLHLYPNPTTGILTVEFTQAAPGTNRFEVYSSTGQQLASQTPSSMPAGPQQIELDLSGFPAGIYFVKLTPPSGEVQWGKLSLQR